MLFLVLLLAFLAHFLKTTEGFSLPHVNATFQNSPKPFKIDVDPAFIDYLHSRVASARAPIPVAGAENDGIPISNFTAVKDYWVNEYSWNDTQASINKQFNQYTTIVHPINSSRFPAVPLHFVHHKSPRSDAIPLLFLHGWPGSFLEVSNMIDRLTNPPNASVPAFHVVAPSTPGFGFSPAPQHPGFGPGEAAHAFNALMLQLNYTKYVLQGGDFGATILHWQTHLYPNNVVSALSNFWPIQPSADDLRRLAEGQLTSDEEGYINNIETFIQTLSGYRIEQEYQPLTIAYLQTDSPLGFAMWIYQLMVGAVDPSDFHWTPSEIITWSMMYTIQGPYGGTRMYKEMLKAGAFSGLEFGVALPTVTRPVAISEFPYDFWYGLPLSWAQRGGNVRRRYVHDHGGHFAAYEVPGELTNDIWDWFGDAESTVPQTFGIAKH